MEGFKKGVLCYLPLTLDFVCYLPLTLGFVKAYRGLLGITFERGLGENVQIIRLSSQKGFCAESYRFVRHSFRKGFVVRVYRHCRLNSQKKIVRAYRQCKHNSRKEFEWKRIGMYRHNSRKGR